MWAKYQTSFLYKAESPHTLLQAVIDQIEAINFVPLFWSCKRWEALQGQDSGCYSGSC